MLKRINLFLIKNYIHNEADRLSLLKCFLLALHQVKMSEAQARKNIRQFNMRSIQWMEVSCCPFSLGTVYMHYWPRWLDIGRVLFFHFTMDRKKDQEKKRKKLISGHLNWTSLVNKGFSILQKDLRNKDKNDLFFSRAGKESLAQ